MSAQPESPTQQPQEHERALRLEATQALGGAAVTGNMIPEPTTTTESEPNFVELTGNQLFAQFVAYSTEGGINLTKKPESLGDRARIVESAHSFVHDYHRRKHQHEWKTNKEHAEAPPLPLVPMQRRIADFYKNPEISLWPNDATHISKLATIHEQYVRRYTERYRTKIPEIDDVYTLQTFLRAANLPHASYALTDLLTVYGQALKGILVQQAQHRQRLEEAQARANRTYDDK